MRHDYYIRAGHRQVSVVHPDGKTIEVDEGLAPLLSALWTLGIETERSCQEWPFDHRALILFSSNRDAEKYFDILYQRLNANGEDWSTGAAKTLEGGRWERIVGYWLRESVMQEQTDPSDYWKVAVGLQVVKGLGPILRPSVSFPVGDCPWVTKAFVGAVK